MTQGLRLRQNGGMHMISSQGIQCVPDADAGSGYIGYGPSRGCGVHTRSNSTGIPCVSGVPNVANTTNMANVANVANVRGTGGTARTGETSTASTASLLRSQRFDPIYGTVFHQKTQDSQPYKNLLNLNSNNNFCNNTNTNTNTANTANNSNSTCTTQVNSVTNSTDNCNINNININQLQHTSLLQTPQHVQESWHMHSNRSTNSLSRIQASDSSTSTSTGTGIGTSQSIGFIPQQQQLQTPPRAQMNLMAVDNDQIQIENTSGQLGHQHEQQHGQNLQDPSQRHREMDSCGIRYTCSSNGNVNGNGNGINGTNISSYSNIGSCTSLSSTNCNNFY